MKYYEQIKSFLLLLLVALSLFLTLLNWSYQPKYKVIEDTKVETKTIGASKSVDETLLPYRIIVSDNNTLYGTVSTDNIKKIIENISIWKASGLEFKKNNLTNDEINNFISKNKHLTFFYSTEVPINFFQSILSFSKSDIPDITFNRLVMDFSKLNEANSITIHFINTNVKTLYSTDVSINETSFQSNVLEHLQDLPLFSEVKRTKELSLYIPIEQVKLNQYTYYIDEVLPDTFKEILFNNPNIVKKNNESPDILKYTDGMSLMTVDTNSKVLNFVNPATEKLSAISKSDLWKNSFEFINNHGGFNGDYRFASVDYKKHVIDYQLFIEGYPVFSSITSTYITSYWGNNNQIFRYKRPYYFLEMVIPSEKKSEQLHSGTKMIQLINETSKMQLSSIDDLVVGYYLVQEDSNLIYKLIPSWFAIIDGNWIRLSPKVMGGVEYGLE